jgi:PPOX class probable FMN-dependent enzyme
MFDDLFADALRDEDALRSIFDPPTGLAVRKEITRIDEMASRFIAYAPILFVGSVAADGRCDVTPRGGPPGFVTVLDERRLAIPDATGNRLVDTYRNVVETGRVGLLFMIPGRGQTLRVNGRACVSARPELLDHLKAVGKPPRVAMVVEVEEVFAHCPKAFVRSKVWEPRSWPAPDAQPSPAELSHAHARDPGLTVADVERAQREALLYRLE